MHAQFLRIKKLSGKAIIEVAARHNHREILAELGASPDGHIDPARVDLNCVLRGHSTAAAVALEAQSLMDAAGVKSLRKDAVRGIEVIFSLPPESSIDHDQFFNDSVQWAGEYFAAPVISAIVHNDESAPHCHVLLLPLVDGRMIGSELVGGRAKLQALQADFQAQVGQRYGLARQTAQKRISAATRKRAMDLAFDVLEANSGLSAAVLEALLAPHASDPAPLLLALGMTMPTSPTKGSFVAMMTKPCKPEKPIGFGKKKPIGFDGSAAPENEQTLPCVGFAKITPSYPPPNEPISASHVTTAKGVGPIIERCSEVEPMLPVVSIISQIPSVTSSPLGEPLRPAPALAQAPAPATATAASTTDRDRTTSQPPTNSPTRKPTDLERLTKPLICSNSNYRTLSHPTSAIEPGCVRTQSRHISESRFYHCRLCENAVVAVLNGRACWRICPSQRFTQPGPKADLGKSEFARIHQRHISSHPVPFNLLGRGPLP